MYSNTTKQQLPNWLWPFGEMYKFTPKKSNYKNLTDVWLWSIKLINVSSNKGSNQQYIILTLPLGVGPAPALPTPIAFCAKRSFAFSAFARSFFSRSSSDNKETSCFAFSRTFIPWSLLSISMCWKEVSVLMAWKFSLHCWATFSLPVLMM